jgi:hypothetical protein
LKPRGAVLGVALILAMAVGSSVGLAQRVLRHSGHVERVDVLGGVVVLDELEARGRRRQHEFHVGPDTLIVSARALLPWERRGGSPDREMEVSLVDLLAGDFVVVDSVSDGVRTVAVRITIIEPRRDRRRAP